MSANLTEVHRLLRPVRRALRDVETNLRVLDQPASRYVHQAALDNVRSALLDLQDAACDARVALPKEVSR